MLDAKSNALKYVEYFSAISNQWRTAKASLKLLKEQRHIETKTYSSTAKTISAGLSPTLRTRIVFDMPCLTAMMGKTISSGKSRMGRGPRANIGTTYCSVFVLQMT